MHRGFAPILVLTIGLAIIAAVSVIYFQLKPKPSILPQPSSLATPTPTDETVYTDPGSTNWKTYTTDKFTFKYPSNLTVEERVRDFFVIVPVGATSAPQQGVSIDARLTGNFTNFDTAVNTAKQNLKDPQTKTISNGVVLSGKLGPGFGENLPLTIALLRYKERAISVERLTTDSTVDIATFNQILSTFKFVE